MDAPPIQYGRTEDGVNIAYWTLGEGPTLLLLQMPGLCHPALEWEVPSARGFYERLAETFRVVRYAPRGTALSDDGDISLDTSAADIIAVLDAIDAASVSLVAGEATIFHAVGVVQRHPERVACVVALGPTMTPHGGGGAIDATVAIARRMPKSQAESFARLMDPEGADPPEPLLRLLREAFDAVAATMSRRLLLAPAALKEIPSLETPLLVIDWPEADGSEGPELARLWPNARLASRMGRGHYWYDPDPRGLALFVRDFVLAHVSPQERQTASLPTDHAPPRTPIVTLLFTDLESSTALTQALGDAKAQEILHGHNDAVRAALAAHDGGEVKHTGDGIFAAFGSAVSAVEAALQIQRDLAGAEVRVRIGLNAGEPIAAEDDYFGTAVQLAARVCDRAEPGQVLVSNVVRELCAGKTFVFADQGEATLKGFPEPVRLFVVAPG